MNTRKQSKINQHFFSFIKSWLPTFSWIFLICYSSLTDSGLPEIKFCFILESDKIAHIGIYSVLTILLVRSWVHVFGPKALIYLLILSSIQVISFSIIMEFLQKLLTKTRHFDLKDIIANISGTVVGVILSWLFYKFLYRSSSVHLSE